MPARDGVNFEDTIFYSNFLRTPQFAPAIEKDDEVQLSSSRQDRENLIRLFPIVAVSKDLNQTIATIELAAKRMTEILNGNRTTYSGFIAPNGVAFAQAIACFSSPERDREVSLRGVPIGTSGPT